MFSVFRLNVLGLHGFQGLDICVEEDSGVILLWLASLQTSVISRSNGKDSVWLYLVQHDGHIH